MFQPRTACTPTETTQATATRPRPSTHHSVVARLKHRPPAIGRIPMASTSDHPGTQTRPDSRTPAPNPNDMRPGEAVVVVGSQSFTLGDGSSTAAR